MLQGAHPTFPIYRVDWSVCSTSVRLFHLVTSPALFAMRGPDIIFRYEIRDRTSIFTQIGEADRDIV